MRRIKAAGAAALYASVVLTGGVADGPRKAAAQATYPQIIRTRYEASNPNKGGQFIIWLDREKVYHGLDPRLYPAVRYVDVTHITPSPGSPIITIVEVAPVTSSTPEFYHIAGIARFKVTGMMVTSSSIPRP